MRIQFFLLLFLILFISGTVSAAFIKVPTPCGNDCTIASTVSHNLNYTKKFITNMPPPAVLIKGHLYEPFLNNNGKWDYCTGQGCNESPKTHATVSGGEVITVLANLVNTGLLDNQQQPQLGTFFKDLRSCKKVSHVSLEILKEHFDLKTNPWDFGTFKTIYGTYGKNELMIYNRDGTFICKAEDPGYYTFNDGHNQIYFSTYNGGYWILGKPALALIKQNSAKATESVSKTSGDGSSVEHMKELELRAVVPVILRKKEDFNYSNLKAYGLSPVNKRYKQATKLRSVIWKKDNKSYGFFWPKKSCLGSMSNRVFYNVTNPDKYPELKRSGAWVNFKYASCGNLKYSKEFLNRQKKLFAESHSTNDAYFYGSYFLTSVTKDSELGKENPKLVGKEIVFVVSEHPTSSIPIFGGIFNFFSSIFSHDKMFYYIVGIAPQTESDSVEPDLPNTENIDFSDLYDFCSSKGANEDNYFVNFTYNDDNINCSAYSYNGFYCDAEQFAKYAKKTYQKVYNPDKVVKHLRERLGDDNKITMYYLDNTPHHISEKSSFFAENGLPLTLDPTIIPYVQAFNGSLDNMKYSYMPSYYLTLFLVKDGACPKEIDPKTQFARQIDLKNGSACYIFADDSKAIKALKDLNDFKLEYLIDVPGLSDIVAYSQVPLSKIKNYEKDKDPLYLPELQFYLLLALGENPLDWGLDVVLLKPDDYNLSAFGKSDLNVNFRSFKVKEIKKGVYKYVPYYKLDLNEPREYLVTMDKKNKFSAYYLFFNRIFEPKGPLYYLSIDPDYPDHLLSNVPILLGTVKSKLIATPPINGKAPNLRINFVNSKDKEYVISHENGYVQIDLPKSLKPKIVDRTFKLLDLLPYTNKYKYRILCYFSKGNKLTIKEYNDSDFLAYENKNNPKKHASDSDNVKKESS